MAAGNNPPQRPARFAVDMAAMVTNWRTFANLSPTTEAAAVVKADAYGLGAGRVGPALAQAGCRTFFVATSGEALSLRRTLGPGLKIYSLGGLPLADAGALRAAGVTPIFNQADDVSAWAGLGGGAYGLNCDTGMNRLGVRPEELGAVRELLKAPGPELVMSHLACASSPGHPLNARQLSRFRAVAAHFPTARASLAATAGALLGDEYRFDLIRPGIGLYGDDGMDTPTLDLAPVADLDAPILQVATLAVGESVGYGASFVADRPMRVATVALGYADGVPRSFAGAGQLWAGGRPRPILGRISMDLIVIDATDGPALAPGDRAELLGPNQSLASVAQASATISYEILCALGAAAGGNA